MKAKTRIVFSLILTLVFTLSLVGTAVAAPSGNATVTPVSGDAVFSVSVVPLLQLPGQTTTAGGLVVPSGFPVGEKQFDSDGVAISGLSYGSAKACFPITALNQGWGGKVGYWNGSVWKLLDTSVSTPQEGTFSWACANISANGTYALLTWVVDASKLVVAKPEISECDFAGDYKFNNNYGYIFVDGPSIGLDVPQTVDLDSLVTYKIIAVDPNWEGSILTGMTGSTTVQINNGRASAWFEDGHLSFSTFPNPAFTARITFHGLGCYVDLDFDPIKGVG